ncbi:hypothetical protein D7V78_16255 [Parabacteroides distasonis]|uniref:Uncharacterized protein n=1 Tax=Parabacteroides distasonis TaxID=823 RepID=A0A3L7ZQP4_PARDI|nr:hypothetical protein D7V78_16255 [Parabacteroides distasonis]
MLSSHCQLLFSTYNTNVSYMKLLIIYLTTGMKTNWKKLLLYIIRIVELVITGAAGGAASGWIG